jgi:hypothetical protein
MLVQTCCTYAEYNKNIFNILNRNGYKIDVWNLFYTQIQF